MHTLWHSGSQQTINSIVTQAAAKFGDKVYLDFSGETYTFAEVDDLATRLACGLRDLGVKPGDTVASILDNSIDAVLAWYGINKLGAISVPVNTAYKGEFLRHQIADSGAKVVLAESHYAERIFSISGVLEDVHTLAIRGEIPGGAPAKLSTVLLDDLKVKDNGFEPHKVKPGDLCMLIYTSGTTGPSKGCMISHNYACNLALQSTRTTEDTAEDVYWTALPLFHMNATATSVLKCAMLGSRCVVYPRFSLSNFWKEMERSGATAVTLLGSMAPLIAGAPDSEESKRCYGQIKRVSTAPFSEELQKTWKKRFGVERTSAGGYGLTEAAMVVHQIAGVKGPPSASGLRNDDFEVIIADDQDNEVPPNTPGEILIRPKRPHVMFEGYWNRQADTLKVMRNMWMHSGDIGKFDEDGFFYFLDRKKDYLRRRGENISSFEMESTFMQHEDIHDVAVHAVFSLMGEDDVKVTAVLKEGGKVTPRELCEWCLDRVPYFAVPRYIEFRDDLPRNPTGKILKYQLRDEGCTSQTWDREKADFKMERR